MANRLLAKRLQPCLRGGFGANGVLSKGRKAAGSIEAHKDVSTTSRAMSTAVARNAGQDAEEESGSKIQRREGRQRSPATIGGMSPWSLTDWDPFLFNTTSLRQMMDAMDRVFDDSLLPTRSGRGLKRSSRIPWDAIEDEEGFHLRVDLPGLSKEDVSVSVEENALIIKAEHAENEEKWKARRGASSYFSRLEIPDSADASQVRGELKNGVLHVTLPKKKVEPKKVINVTIN